MPKHPELSDKTFYYFDLSHPLTFTHIQVLDLKHKVAVLAGRVPKIKMNDGHPHQPSLDRYGRYMGTLLCPWDANGRCEVETWEDYYLKRKQWADDVSEIVRSDRSWERHCVMMNLKSDQNNVETIERSMVNQPFPDPRPLHYLMVDRNVRLSMKTDLESAILVRKWRSRSADWFTSAEKANASRKWDSTFSSGGDDNPNSANSKLLHKLLDKITSGYLKSGGVSEDTRLQIENLLNILGECMPQHIDHNQQADRCKLNWGKYSPTWAQNRIKEIHLIGKKNSQSCTKCVGSKKQDRLESIDKLRIGLSKSQLAAFNNVVSITDPESKSFSGEPLRMFVHGGPGTGKTHLVETIKEFANLYGKTVRCMSVSGCAAKLIGGITCHSAAALKIALPREGDLNEPTKRQTVQKKMRDKHQEPVWLYIIDEISMMHSDLFAILSDRIGLLHSSPGSMNRKLSFGGAHVIILGDMLQLPAVKQTPLHKDCVDQAMGRLRSHNCKPRRMSGIRLFQKFRKFELKPHVNGRSQDRQHSENIRQMREEGRQPITKRLLSCYKRLSMEDDSEFEFAPLLTPTNVERQSVNKNAAVRFARKHGLPVFFWVDRYGKVPAAVRRRNPNELTIMAEKYFVVGAPCVITKNMNPTNITGVVNGSKGVLHSLSWSNGYQPPTEWEPGEIVPVQVPSHVNVLLDKETHKKNGGVLPCAINASSTVRVGGGQLRLRQHPVTLLFAVTPFKVQGQTTPRLILDLRHKEGKGLRNLSFEDIYVAISRVKMMDHLRIITSGDGNLDHITRLKRPEHFFRWLECYTEDDIFNGSRLKELGDREYAKALSTVQNWSVEDLRKQRKPRLLTLARILNLSVKKTGKGNQPCLADAWNAIFPVWKAGNKEARSKYKSRQETYHDQNLMKKTPPPVTSHNVMTNTNTSKRTKSGTTTEVLQTPRHPPRKKGRKSCSRSSSIKKSNGNGSQSHKKRKSTGSSTSRCVRRRLGFNNNNNTRPPQLINLGNTCYINAGLQALAGSSNILSCINRIKQNGNSTRLINSLGSVCTNYSDVVVNMSIRDSIMNDIDLSQHQGWWQSD